MGPFLLLGFDQALAQRRQQFLGLLAFRDVD
jgi:hypothetical protein